MEPTHRDLALDHNNNEDLDPSDPPQHSSLPYTANPWLLCLNDFKLFRDNTWTIPGVLLPWNKWMCGELDELYPSWQNDFCIGAHLLLLSLHTTFIVSLPFSILFPVWLVLLYVSLVLGITFLIARLLNGRREVLKSDVELEEDKGRFVDECWIYLNGVSTGKHWLRSNLTRLSLTFRRPIIGIHNQTYGIIFDLLQCIIERNFGYATLEIRNAYAVVKEKLLDERYKKVVLILHSQGGIEGGAVVDWCLSELSHDTISKLEIYTFGCAANHFNNPNRTSQTGVSTTNIKAISHIEHYANDGDFVSRWGVLNFAIMKNRYAGRVFIRPGTGHLLNQHYLNSMFPLGNDKHVLETNDFMDSKVDFEKENAEGREDESANAEVESRVVIEDGDDPIRPVSMGRTDSAFSSSEETREMKVRQFSRLWEYRNGRSPRDFSRPPARALF